MSSDCQNLDAYLAGELLAEDAAHFSDHLRHCAVCRDSVNEQQWLDAMLQSPLRTQLEPAPGEMVAAMQTSLASRDRGRRRIVTAAMAAAAIIAVAVGWVQLNRQAGDETTDETASPNIASHDRGEIRPRATFVASSNVIAVPVVSHHPDVTVVRVYPTFQPRYETQTAAIQPEAATHDNWTKYSNGG